jgi:hypothetical protein
MTCLVVSALLFSPFAWKVGAALSLLGAFLMAAAFMSACVVGHEADLQSEAQYRAFTRTMSKSSRWRSPRCRAR